MSKIAITIPCYNEAGRLPVKEILSFLEKNSFVHICFVNDGSKDDTAGIIDDAASKCPDQVKTLHLQKNSGKAEAIRQGILLQLANDNYDWLGYWDADLATPLDEIEHLLQFSEKPANLLMCSRVKRMGAVIQRHLWRHLLGRVMATAISMTLKLPVYDTQCGAKLIRRDDIEHVFTEPFVARWLFDVEIIARMKQKYKEQTIYQRIIEVPMYRWKDVPGSKLLLKHMFSSLVGILRIYWKYNIRLKDRK